MAIGVYGTVRPSDVSIDDIEMYYNYIPNRNTSNNDMFTLDPNDMLDYCYLPDDDPNIGATSLLEGLYNLTIPASIFNETGIYTIFIRPKMISLTIADCSVLSALPTVKGIVINSADLPEALRTNNALQGHRIEYVNNDGSKLRNTVRYVVTSNKVSVTTENIGNSSQKAQRYRFDDAGTQIFLQLTPSSASDTKPNATPFIGTIGQTILISNTYFTPLAIEIELSENTIDTLSELIAGEQIKDVNNGILTYYDKNRVITKQFNLYEVKDDITDVPLYEVKEKRENIDNTQDFNTVIEDIE